MAPKLKLIQNKIRIVCLFEKPSLTNVWDGWSSPPVDMGMFFKYLLIETKVVSKIGIIIIRTGIKNVAKTLLAGSDVNFRHNNDKQVPRKKLPESPMNIFAGGKLNIKKPRHAPINVIETLIVAKSFIVNKKREITNKDIIDIPEDKPSRLSIRFTALIIPENHKIVNGKVI